MLFTTQWLQKLFKKTRGDLQQSIDIHQVTTDSREPSYQGLFIPLIGEHFDGHQFIFDAIERGAVAALWQGDRPLPDTLNPSFPIFYVDDTLVALQELAATYRQLVDPIVIGITGSNGKTTTKDLVTSVVQTQFQTHATEGNFNNHIGLPLTILGMPRHTEILVLEMGMNNYNEINRLTDIARPDYAIITNIGESHIEFLGSRAGIAQAKLEIIHGMDQQGVLIIDGDDPLLTEKNYPLHLIRCGFQLDNDVSLKLKSISIAQTVFHLLDEDRLYTVPLAGKHHAKNAAFAVIIGRKLNISVENIQKGLEQCNHTGMRFETVMGRNGVTIINDAYNASPTSMKAAIEVVKHLNGFKHKVLVLGDIFELGHYAEELHRSVASAIDAHITVLFTYGKHAKHIVEAVDEQLVNLNRQHFTSQEELTKALEPYLKPDTVILCKASRGMQFETIVHALQ